LDCMFMTVGAVDIVSPWVAMPKGKHLEKTQQLYIGVSVKSVSRQIIHTCRAIVQGAKQE
jgi:hypothetical protein